MTSLSDAIVTALVGYSSRKSQEAINQPQGECVIKSVIEDGEILKEMLQQAATIRNMRT